MKHILFLFSLVLISCFELLGQNASDKPNVLFISVDDLNNWAGYLGHPDAITPNMDRIAESGVFFENAYCQYAVCGPSRASVLSGMYYHSLDLELLQSPDEDVEDAAAAKGSSLLYEYFSNEGYETMAVGKILHRHVPTSSVDQSGGRGSWDFNYDSNGNRVRTHWESDNTSTDWAPFTGREEDMSDTKAAEWAVQRLQEDHDDPFLLMTGFLRPHVPWYVPQKYFDMYDPDELTLPPYDPDDFDDLPPISLTAVNEGYPRTEWAIEQNQWRNILQAYLASITYMDTQLGKVLDALEASSYKDNTIIVLWSDHGYHLGEKNTFQKHTLWERSVVAPLIISAPGMQQGVSSTKNVQLMDLYPTLLDLCGLPPNDKLLGRSIKPLLQNPEKDWDYPAFSFRKEDGKSVYMGNYHYIEYGDASIELYDLDNDPDEWVNLAESADYASVITEMQELFGEYNIFPVTGVELSPSTLTLEVGETAVLEETVTDENASNRSVLWESSDNAVVSVDASGEVTALSSGSVVITVTTNDGGFTASCNITVIEDGGTPITLNPIADTYVRGGDSANENFGEDALMVVKKGSIDNFFRKGYLKFDLSDIDEIQYAALRLYANEVIPFRVSVYEASDDWAEDEATWNNVPMEGGILSTTLVSTSKRYYEWDITSYVQSEAAIDDTVSLVVYDAESSNQQIAFNTKEASDSAPELTVIGITKEVLGSNRPEFTYDFDVSIYPNPVMQNDLTLQSSQMMNVARVISLSGEVLKTYHHLKAYQASLNVDFLNAGMYFVVIETDNGSVCKKIMKQ